MNLYDFSDLQRPVSLRECIASQDGLDIKHVVFSFVPLIVVAVVMTQGAWQVIGVLLFICATSLGVLTLAQWQAAKTRVRLSYFARRNNMSFQSKVPYDGREGVIFSPDRSGYFRDLLGVAQGIALPTEIGTYYSLNKARSAKARIHGVMCITLPQAFSQMVLDAHANNMLSSKYVSNLPQVYASSQKVSINKQYDEYFTLYADARYMHEIHQIFTPDLLQLIVSSPQGRFYDYEIIGNRFYVYAAIGVQFVLANKQSLQELLGFSSRLADQLNAQITGQKSSYAELPIRSAETLPPPTVRRLRTKVSIVRILLSVAAIGVTVYLYVVMREVYPALNFPL